MSDSVDSILHWMSLSPKEREKEILDRAAINHVMLHGLPFGYNNVSDLINDIDLIHQVPCLPDPIIV